MTDLRPAIRPTRTRSIAVATTHSSARAALTLTELEQAGLQRNNFTIVAYDVRLSDAKGYARHAAVRLGKQTAFAVSISVLTVAVLATLGWIDPLASLSVVTMTAVLVSAILTGSIALMFHVAGPALSPPDQVECLIAERYDIVTNDAQLAERARNVLI